MKLNQNQLSQIEKHLNYRELTQLDLRNEVLDHMALNIEKKMENDNLYFIDAFNEEVQTWNSELESYYSFWLGAMWVGPKIMMKKCVKEVKQIYLIALSLAVLTVVVGAIFVKVLEIEIPMLQISNGLGVIYLLLFVLTLIGDFRIRASSFETSYKYLYKINTIAIVIPYLLMNPLWNSSMNIPSFSNTNFLVLAYHVFSLVFGYQFWVLYKKHFDTEKTLVYL